MTTAATALERLARLCGVVDEYADIRGERHPTTPETRRALLEAMGIDIASAGAIEAAIREREERDWRRLGIWRNKQGLYRSALAGIDAARVERLLQSCATLDRLGKGQQNSEYPGEDWMQLESLVLAFSSVVKGFDERSIA